MRLGLTFFLFSSLAHGADFGVGQKNFTFNDAARSRLLEVHVWYPVEAKTVLTAVVQKGNPFLPVVSAVNAPLANQKTFPLVLLSHGSGGKADKLFWLTDRLVRSGRIVLSVDHPHNKTGDNSADGMMRVWDRATDLSYVLDKILEENFFRSRVNLGKIAATGHSAGGTTVLLLAGARLSAAKLTSPIPTCAGTKDPYLAKLCDELKTVDVKKYPKDVVERDYADARVKAVVALDPGFVRSFQTDTFKQLKAKPLLLLAEKMNTSHDQILAKEFNQHLAPSEVEVVPGSFHMTFLQACKSDFPKDDAELAELCVENENKLKLQKMIGDRALAFLKGL